MNDNEIKRAFESMGPTPDAERRMLAAILAANASEQEECMAPAPKRAVLKTVLPLAACLALLAGIGIFAAASLNLSSMNASLSASSEIKLSADLSAENAAEEPSGESAADPARTTSFIVLWEGTELRIATDDASVPLIAEPALVGDELGEAEARDEANAVSRTCTVHEYADVRYPYAIRYQGDTVLYLAMPAHE